MEDASRAAHAVVDTELPDTPWRAPVQPWQTPADVAALVVGGNGPQERRAGAVDRIHLVGLEQRREVTGAVATARPEIGALPADAVGEQKTATAGSDEYEREIADVGMCDSQADKIGRA